jgi:hypothetical protein
MNSRTLASKHAHLKHSRFKGSGVQRFWVQRFRGSGFSAAAGLKSGQSNRRRN